ncbi:MAG TPA: DUF6580 family putative transport protein [Lacipirellulaceae bacterium]|jgi:hypothetical protein|nr:DUF6580 family putative transport protein [Lacipirellulaceae bacterium]
MKTDRQQNLQDLLVFFLLVAIGVAGRWGQPEWCFTPMAAAAIFAGWYFSRWAIAVLVPVAILAISDLILPAYDNIPVLLATYIVMTLPVALGRMQRRSQSRQASAGQWALFALVPATLFYIVTNFAVWEFQSSYEKTFAGLMQCYAAAVPFYRWMLTGDVFYLSVLLGCWIIAAAPKFSDAETAMSAK